MSCKTSTGLMDLRSQIYIHANTSYLICSSRFYTL